MDRKSCEGVFEGICVGDGGVMRVIKTNDKKVIMIPLK